MRALIFKQEITNSTYKFLKTLHALRLADLFSLLWNIYPTMDFVERNHDRL